MSFGADIRRLARRRAGRTIRPCRRAGRRHLHSLHLGHHRPAQGRHADQPGHVLYAPPRGRVANGAGQRQSRRDADVPYRRLRLRFEHDDGRRPHRADARGQSGQGDRVDRADIASPTRSSCRRSFNRCCRVPGVETSDLSSLQLLMYGASPIGDVLLRRALERTQMQFHAGLRHDREPPAPSSNSSPRITIPTARVAHRCALAVARCPGSSCA